MRTSKRDTIGDVGREWGVKFEGNPRMKLSTWLRRNGLPSLARALEKVSKKK